MSAFKAGFARIDITPPLGLYVSGYYEPRIADGVLDPLLASAVAFSDGQETAIVFSLDVAGIWQKIMDDMRESIAASCGLPRRSIFITCFHNHTGPEIDGRLFPNNPAYNERLTALLAQAANLAINDLQPAELLTARGTLSGINFIRRFRMKDGTVRTNPGRHNPDIDHPIGSPDEAIQLVRIRREGALEIDLVNFQVHPDVVEGCKYAADYVKFVRDSLEGALGNNRCLYLNGAQGDLNHIDVHCPDWDENNGYEHAKHMGRSIAGAVLQIYTKARPVEADIVRSSEIQTPVAANKGDPSQLPLARKYIALHDAGRDEEIPETGMGITTLVAEAHRLVELADVPDSFQLNITAIRIGDFCIAGIPGEPFTEIGRRIKQQSPFDMQFVCCCANGYEGYFPTPDAYAEGGYEARSSNFKADVAEQLITASVQNIESLRR